MSLQIGRPKILEALAFLEHVKDRDDQLVGDRQQCSGEVSLVLKRFRLRLGLSSAQPVEREPQLDASQRWFEQS